MPQRAGDDSFRCSSLERNAPTCSALLQSIFESQLNLRKQFSSVASPQRLSSTFVMEQFEDHWGLDAGT